MANEPAISCVPVTTDMYPALTSLDHAQDDPWSADMLQYRFKDKNVIGHAALINGEIAGYVIYQRDDDHHQNSILKFTLDPRFIERASEIQERLLDLVKSDMSLEGRNHIVLYTDSTDEGTLAFFRRSHGEFKRLNAAGTGHVMLIYEMPDIPKRRGYAGSSLDSYSLDTGVNHPGFGFGSTSFVGIPSMDGLSITGGSINAGDITPPGNMPGNMDAPLGSFSFSSNNLPDTDTDTPEWASAPEEPEPSRPAPKKLSAAAIAVRAREKLTELTGMEWETVTLDKRGKWIPTQPHEAKDEDIYLQTASKVANPKAALDAVCEYMAQKPVRPHASKLDQSAQIVIPVSWVRPIHLELGRAKQLANAFVPASTQLRYQPSEAIAETASTPARR